MILGCNVKIHLTPAPIFMFALLIFFVVELSAAALPYRAIGYDSESNIIYYCVFASFFVFGMAVSKISERVSFVLPSAESLTRLINRFICFSIVGFFAVIYDRLYIQGVDYSNGIALARESWRESATSRIGVSSPFSVIGNLIFPFVFFAFSLTFIFFEDISKCRIKIYISLILIMLFSILTGGRELVLVLASVGLASMCFRKYLHLSLAPRNFRKDMILGLLVILFFSIYIGFSRSQTYAESFNWYSDSLATRLGGIPEEESLFSAFVPSILYPVLIYVAHVKWVFINVIQFEMDGGLSIFRQLVLMLGKYFSLPVDGLGYSVPGYSPNWISGIGSIYYDLGPLGVFFAMFSFLVGWGLLSGVLRIREFNQSLFSIMFGTFFFSVIIMLPFALMLEIVQFIYMLVPLMFSAILSFLYSFRKCERLCK